MKQLQEFPIKADKVVKDAMREASKAVAQNIRPKMPNKTFRKAVKYKVSQRKDGNTYALVGILDSKKHNNGGKIPRPFLKAYWKNYGTLANRDPQHKFAQPRKSISSGWRGGIKPSHFFEQAMSGTDEMWKRTFYDAMDKKAKERKLLDE